MYCNKCGKELDNGAVYCSFCGAKQKLVKYKEKDKTLIKKDSDTDAIVNVEDSEVEVLENDELGINENYVKKGYKSIDCPHCGSENIQKFSLVYLNGIGKIDGTTVGVGTGGLYGGLVNGKSQTALSEITAPPKKKWVIRRFLLMWILMDSFVFFLNNIRVNDFVWFNNLVIIFLALLVPIYYAVRGYIYNKKIYQRLYYLWDKKYLCLKCSQWFYLDKEKENLTNEENEINTIVKKWVKRGKVLFFGTILVIILFYAVSFADTKISGTWSSNGRGNYYFNPEGKKESNKLINYHGENYYILEDGQKLVKSWKEIDNELYYFGSTGKMFKNSWVNYENNKYHVDIDGKLERNKWIGNRYVGADGKMLVNTITPDGKQVNEKGYVIK